MAADTATVFDNLYVGGDLRHRSWGWATSAGNILRSPLARAFTACLLEISGPLLRGCNRRDTRPTTSAAVATYARRIEASAWGLGFENPRALLSCLARSPVKTWGAAGAADIRSGGRQDQNEAAPVRPDSHV